MRLNSFPISFIGAGNVAWHMAPALENAGYPVLEVFSRNLSNAKSLQKMLYESNSTSELDFSSSQSKLFILALSDDALEEVIKELIVPENSIVVHTSGTQPISILEYLPEVATGVIYPLQTFSKSKALDFSEVPIFIEGSDSETEDLLFKMMHRLCKNTNRLDSRDRKVIHLSAVFSSNFVNHLFSISERILKETGNDFKTLHPLIIETINKSLAIGPENAQTGPAIRNDRQVIQQHLNLLADKPELYEIYRMLTDGIILGSSNSEN